jgi:MFS family permease
VTAVTRRAVTPLVTVLGGNVLFATGLIFHAFLYNFYIEALHLSPQVMGRAVAALTGGGLLVLLPAGAFADRAGPRHAAVAAAVVLALGLALGALAAVPAAIYGAAALAGAGSGFWRVATAPILMRVTAPDSRSRAFAWNVGLLVAWGGAGTAMAGATSHWLEAAWGLDRLAAIRVALLLGAAASAASLPLFRAIRLGAAPAGAASPAAASAGGDAPPASARAVLPLVGLVGLWMLGPAIAAPFLNIYFSRVHGVAIERIAFVFGAVSWCWALGVIGSGEVARRVGVRRLLLAMPLFFAPAMLGLSAAGNVGLAVALYALQGLVAPVTNPLVDQWLLAQTPAVRQGAVSSWRQVAADASAMVGASIGGQVLAGGGFQSLFLVAGGVGLLGAAGLVAGVARRSRH